MPKHTPYERVSSKTWTQELHSIADYTIERWVSAQVTITSLELKNEIRTLVGPHTQVLQADVSRYLTAAMRNREFVEGYTAVERRVPTNLSITYLEYFPVKKTDAVPASVFEKAQPAVRTPEPEVANKESVWYKIKSFFKHQHA